MRLFYLVWSGVTKCLQSIVQKQQRAIELPGFGIFGPIFEKHQGTRDPMDKGVKQRLAAVKLGIVPVFLVLNDDWINTLNDQVSLDQVSEKAVGRFDRYDRSEVNELFRNKVSPLTVSSIASISMTDSATVDNVLKEIFTTIAELAKDGRSLRINFKVGSLVISNN